MGILKLRSLSPLGIRRLFGCLSFICTADLWGIACFLEELGLLPSTASPAACSLSENAVDLLFDFSTGLVSRLSCGATRIISSIKTTA